MHWFFVEQMLAKRWNGGRASLIPARFAFTGSEVFELRLHRRACVNLGGPQTGEGTVRVVVAHFAHHHVVDAKHDQIARRSVQKANGMQSVEPSLNGTAAQLREACHPRLDSLEDNFPGFVRL